MLNLLLAGTALGIGATIVLDAWSYILKLTIGQPTSNWSILGRWAYYFVRGRFSQQNVGGLAAAPGEYSLGLAVHIGTGIVFGMAFALMVGPDWFTHLSVGPALGWGVATIVFPWFFLQPSMGFGVAASKTPRPWRARLVGLSNHAMFGVGLWLSGLCLSPWFHQV